MKTEIIHIANNIKKLKKKMNLSQKDLAFLLKLESNSTVSGYESGKWYPPLDHVIILSKLFNVGIEDLILKKL